MSNPANRLPPEYDEMQPQDYDPQFTADISTRMRIPHKLGPVTGLEHDVDKQSMEQMVEKDLQRTARMNVPDKIIVAGQERSVGARKMPELHLDPFPDPQQYPRVGLQTPPRTLTLDERPFPAVGDMEAPSHYQDYPGYGADPDSFLAMEEKLPQTQNGYIQRTPQKQHDDSLHRQALLATPGDHLLIADEAQDDIQVMRKQIAKLSYHIIKLEKDNSKRSQRELVLYPMVLGYVLLQVAKWFLSNK